MPDSSQVASAPNQRSQLLALLSKENAMEAATQAVMSTLTAKRAIWDAKAAKHTLVDDHAIQMKAAELVWAYEEGLPVKRQEIITGQMDSQETLERQARKSPALRSSLKRLIARVESDQTKRAKSSKTVDEPVTDAADLDEL